MILSSTTTFGCGSKQATESEAAQPASDPQTDRAADDKATEDLQAGRVEGVKAQPANGDPNARYQDRAADDKATEDLQAGRAEQAKVAEAKAATDADAVTAHKATQEQLQASFDTSDRRLNALKEKVAKLTGTKKQKATAAVAVADKHSATVMASIAKLREATLARWDGAKVQVESDSVAFNKSIDALEATVQ